MFVFFIFHFVKMGVKSSQDEMGEVGDSRSEIGDDFHSDENPDHWVTGTTHRQKRVVWGRADDILIISKAESQAAEPPRVFTHDEKLYTNDNLLRIISEEKYDRGVTGMCEDWMVRQQGVLFIKLRWAITEGLKIYVHACENHLDMMNRAEELIASVGEETSCRGGARHLVERNVVAHGSVNRTRSKEP